MARRPLKLSGIKAITFDIGGTLIQPWPSVGHIYARVAEKHGLGKISPESLNGQFASAWRRKANFNHSRDWQALVNQTFAGLSQTSPTPEMFADLYQVFAAPEAWRIFDEVTPVLEQLKSFGYRLAVISNWDERLRPLLRGLRLDSYFDPIIVSFEVGCGKPSPKIFTQAQALLRLPARDILHIGDSPREDVAAAKAAGFQALLLARSARPCPPGGITSLQEIFSGK